MWTCHVWNCLIKKKTEVCELQNKKSCSIVHVKRNEKLTQQRKEHANRGDDHRGSDPRFQRARSSLLAFVCVCVWVSKCKWSVKQFTDYRATQCFLHPLEHLFLLTPRTAPHGNPTGKNKQTNKQTSVSYKSSSDGHKVPYKHFGIYTRRDGKMVSRRSCMEEVYKKTRGSLSPGLQKHSGVAARGWARGVALNGSARSCALSGFLFFPPPSFFSFYARAAIRRSRGLTFILPQTSVFVSYLW